MKQCKNVTGWTDYPIVELGDISGKRAPIRRVEVLSYDGDKYVTIQVMGTKVVTSFKCGYLYQTKGRCGDVKVISRLKLERMVEVERP